MTTIPSPLDRSIGPVIRAERRLIELPRFRKGIAGINDFSLNIRPERTLEVKPEYFPGLLV
jgi:hypothetical protein